MRLRLLPAARCPLLTSTLLLCAFRLLDPFTTRHARPHRCLVRTPSIVPLRMYSFLHTSPCIPSCTNSSRVRGGTVLLVRLPPLGSNAWSSPPIHSDLLYRTRFRSPVFVPVPHTGLALDSLARHDAVLMLLTRAAALLLLLVPHSLPTHYASHDSMKLDVHPFPSPLPVDSSAYRLGF